jgi:hypothetical protein
MRTVSAMLAGVWLLCAACADRPGNAEHVSVAAGAHVTPVPDRSPDQPPPGSPSDSLVLRIESLAPDSSQLSPGSLIVLADSTELELPIHDARLVYALPATLGARWLLLRGHGCTACDAPLLVWAFRTPPQPITTRYRSFPFPGAWLSSDDAGVDDKPYFRSRMFVGECLDDADPVAVWLEETLKPESDKAQEVRVLRGTPQLHDTTFAWSADIEKRIEERTSAGACREVPPRDQITL